MAWNHKHIVFVFCLLAGFNMASAQIIESAFNEEVLMRRVDLLEVFFERFNFEKDFERKEILDRGDVTLHKKYLLSLFDASFLMDTTGMVDNAKRKALVADFLEIVTNSANPITLSYTDSTWFAKVICNCKYEKQDCQITLFLKTELVRPNEFKWVVFDADSDFLKLKPDDKYIRQISPVEHEMRFMGLDEITDPHNCKSAVAYANKSFVIDPLSVFFAMIYDKSLVINNVADVEYHFYNVPGFQFTVRFVERQGYNAGWLITDLVSINNCEHKKQQKL